MIVVVCGKRRFGARGNSLLFGNGVREGCTQGRTRQGYVCERGVVVERTHGFGGVHVSVGEDKVDTSRSVILQCKLTNGVRGI